MKPEVKSWGFMPEKLIISHNRRDTRDSLFLTSDIRARPGLDLAMSVEL